MKIVVLDGRALNPGDLSWEALRALGTVEVHDRTPPELVVPRAEGAAAVLTNKTPLGADAIAALPALRYIGVLATGFNVVDVAAARGRGIPVSNVPAYGTDSVAQFTFALLLELCHRVGLHADAVREGAWSRHGDWCFWRTPQVELAGKTMGIVGFGRIGRQVGAIAHAMGMRVVATGRRRGENPPWVTWMDLDELLPIADVVSLHCPLTPETKHLMDASRLARMRPTAFLLNTSRGPLVVEESLAAALEAGRLAGAAVDVLSVEPPPEANRLVNARNCLVTPHMAWGTREARARLMQVAVENVAAFQAGRPRNVVNA